MTPLPDWVLVEAERAKVNIRALMWLGITFMVCCTALMALAMVLHMLAVAA